MRSKWLIYLWGLGHFLEFCIHLMNVRNKYVENRMTTRWFRQKWLFAVKLMVIWDTSKVYKGQMCIRSNDWKLGEIGRKIRESWKKPGPSHFLLWFECPLHKPCQSLIPIVMILRDETFKTWLEFESFAHTNRWMLLLWELISYHMNGTLIKGWHLVFIFPLSQMLACPSTTGCYSMKASYQMPLPFSWTSQPV